MAGNDQGDAGDVDRCELHECACDRVANARYLYLKRRLPGESYDAVLERLTDEFVGNERSLSR